MIYCFNIGGYRPTNVNNSEVDIEYVEMASLSDHMSHLPTMMDPEMWRVHVHVSRWHSLSAPDTDYELLRMELNRKASGPCTIICWPIPDLQCPY